MSMIAGKMAATIGPWLSGREGKGRSVKSAERTLALFELFSLNQRPMGVSEIARSLGIPQPSVSMLVQNLCRLGYLDHDRRARTYVPTLRIMMLGSWVHRRFSQEYDIDRRIDTLLELGESVVMGIQNGIYSQYILGRLPDEPDSMEVQSGLLRPITCTAIGRALLSLKPDAEVEAIARACNAEVSEERLRVRPSEFLGLITQIREQGYSRTSGDMVPGRAVIAVVVHNPLGSLPVAVGVGGTVERVAEKEAAIISALQSFRLAGAEAPPGVGN